MLKLTDYEETIDYLEFEDGRIALLPSEWDIAAEHAKISDLEHQRDDIEAESLPPTLADHAATVAKFEKAAEGEELPPRAEYERSAARVREWEDRRTANWQYLNNTIRASLRLLESIENGPKATDEVDEDGCTRKQAVFVFKTFSHATRVQIDDDHITIDAETHAKELDTSRRNVALLRASFVGVREGGQTKKLDGEIDEVVHDAVVRVLIGRMWARNSMNDQLVPYFRSGRKTSSIGGKRQKRTAVA